MFDTFQRHWLRLLRVPLEPAAPRGEPGVRIFRAAPRLYTWLRVKWAVAQFFALVIPVLASIAARQESLTGGFDKGPAGLIVSGINGLLWLLWLIQFVVTYTLLRLDFEQRWYILTDRSLRIREGVLWLNEKTMTFANIQHLTVKQGPLQRLLGIADLEVRTAGGGAIAGTQSSQGTAVGSTHIARFRGVDNAEEIRAVIRDRIRLHRDAGLGDPDDEPTGRAPDISASAGSAADDLGSPALLAAARELGAEARALREAMARA